MNLLNSLLEPVKAFYEVIHDGIVITDLSGTVAYVNKSTSSILGYSKNDLLKKNVLECFFPDASLDEILLTLAQKQSYTISKSCKKKKGHEQIFTLCYSLLNDTSNKPLGILIIFKHPDTPFNEQNYFEQHSSMLHALNFQSREIIFVSDVKNKRNMFCSQAVEKILGWTQKDFSDGGWGFALSLTHPEDTQDIVEHFANEIERREKEKFVHDHIPIIYEYRKRNKKGDWLWVKSESLVLERDENGEVKYLITFTKDISKELRIRSTELTKKVKLDLSKNNNHAHKKQPVVHLSKREKEILDLLKTGLSTKEIADILSLKSTSVSTYRKSLMEKLKVKNTAELVQKSHQVQIA
jgi:PAS domain S-box-containing protein